MVLTPKEQATECVQRLIVLLQDMKDGERKELLNLLEEHYCSKCGGNNDMCFCDMPSDWGSWR